MANRPGVRAHGPAPFSIADAADWQGPVRALVEAPGCLAVIAGTEGPSYRAPGAVMAILTGGRCVGSLSSGCIEADLVRHAEAALGDGRPRTLRYGVGGPRDLELPCGGGLDIVLVPMTGPAARAVLAEALALAEARQEVSLLVETACGGVRLDRPAAVAGADGSGRVVIPCRPEIALHVLGRGIEAQVFAALAVAAGFPVALHAPDEETCAAGRAAGATVRPLPLPGVWQPGALDPRAGVVLFFHDHDWEPPLLAAALASEAFYIGAQGSLRAHATRCAALGAMGVAPEAIDRLRAPIGLIPSARDPRLLAISVLAEIVDAARRG